MGAFGVDQFFVRPTQPMRRNQRPDAGPGPTDLVAQTDEHLGGLCKENVGLRIAPEIAQAIRSGHESQRHMVWLISQACRLDQRIGEPQRHVRVDAPETLAF